MMIKNIKLLKNLGIFKDYSQNDTKTDTKTKDFNQFNLVYGWNGSGKTTLVDLFNSLKKKTLPDRFKGGSDFEITLNNNDNNKVIKKKDLDEVDLNIHVFNNEFIKENINWDSSVKSILLVAEEKIEQQKQLKDLKDKQLSFQEKYKELKEKITQNKENISKFMTNSAKSIKKSLQAIDTNDRYFMNYKKPRLEGFVEKNKENIQKQIYLLEAKEVQKCTEGAKPNKKDLIEFNLQPTKYEDLDKKKNETSLLFGKNIVNRSIDRLTTNSDIQSWVETGLRIHKEHSSKECEFCKNQITESRKKELEGHFNKEFEEYKSDLSGVLRSVDEFDILLENRLPNSDSLYEEYKEDFKNESRELRKASESINKALEEWKNVIKEKIENPFNRDLKIEVLDKALVIKFNNHIQSIKDIVENHNKKTKNFEEKTKGLKKKLEGHYITEELHKFDYFQKEEDLESKNKNLESLNSQIKDRGEKIRQLEHSLSNEGLGAEEINTYLHHFLGRDNISLQFNTEEKGYNIVRDQENETHSKNLSEGEKRAIAFIYFITKLKEKDNKIENSVVIIDDPVSSFDSNNLFHAYSFLKEHCEKSKQLFIFTHNFTFFKLVRDWLVLKLKKTPSNFYIIETISSQKRESKLQNAPESLIEYNSEYHYIFEKLYKFKNSNKLDVNEAFLTANLSRKLLESFFYFKYPEKRQSLSTLFDDGRKNCKKTTPQIKEAIYNFINKYSHSDKIETNEEVSENLMGERSHIINDIFTWIEEVDKIHYEEMVKVVSSDQRARA